MKHYKFIDYCVQSYLIVVGLLILLFHGPLQPCWHVMVGLHVVVLIAVHLLIRAYAARPGNGIIELLRHFYPLILYTPLYSETGLLNHMFVSRYLDSFFIGLEQRMFGFQPSIAFMDALPYAVVSEVLYAFYFSYYAMLLCVGLMLYLRDKRYFFHYVSVLTFAFYVCYLIYIFLPVVGSPVFTTAVPGFAPQGQWAFFPLPYPEAVARGPMFHVMGVIYANFEAHGAAFPSSHVAIGMITLYFSWLYRLSIRRAHLVVVIMLSAATVYCRYHYLVDVLAGAVLALPLLWIGDKLYHKFE